MVEEAIFPKSVEREAKFMDRPIKQYFIVAAGNRVARLTMTSLRDLPFTLAKAAFFQLKRTTTDREVLL